MLDLLSKEEIIKTLPKFTYHPNLYNFDYVTFDKAICDCCGKEVDAYISSIYSRESVNAICMQCIYDGSAATKFDGSFIQDAEKVSDPHKVDLLLKRTPGYNSWQGEYWLACCDDYCEYIGDVGTKELDELGISDEVISEYCKKFNQNGHLGIDLIKNRLIAKGFLAGYLFKCKHCGKYHLYIDMD